MAPPRPALVQAAIDRTLADIDSLPDGALRALYPELRRAAIDAGERLAGWLGDQKGGDRFTAAHRRQALLRLRTALERIERRLPAATLRSLRTGSDEAAVMAARHLGAETAAMRRAFATLPDQGPLPISEASIMAQGRHLLVPRHAASAARYGKDIGRDIRGHLTRGMLAGDTVDQMITRLVRLGGPRGLVSMGGGRVEDIPEGLFTRYRHWGERLVRTEVMHAYNVQKEIGLRDANHDDPGWKRAWDASRDRRTCPICAYLDGKVAEVGKSFPGGYRRAPAHPHCRCVEVPHRDEWAGVQAPPPPIVAKPPVAVDRAKPPNVAKPLTAPSKKGMIQPERKITPTQIEASKTLPSTMIPVLSAEQAAAVREYAGPAHAVLNSQLRGRGDRAWSDSAEVRFKIPGAPDHVVRSRFSVGELRDQLDAAIAKAAVPDDLVTFRGMKDYDSTLAKLKKGDILDDPAYKSTTMLGWGDAKKLSGVGGLDVNRGERVVFTIQVPRGSRALDLSGVLRQGGETGTRVNARELLLPRQTKFRVLEVEMRDGVRAVLVRAEQ